MPKDPVESPDHGRVESMTKIELEQLVINEIRKHRNLMESDQIIYDEWEKSASDPFVSQEHVERLEAECLVRREKTLAQQETLSRLLRLLGFIPKVSDAHSQDVNRVQEDRDP